MSITPEQAAHETRDTIVSFVSGFMTDPATYAYAAGLGFEGSDFYTAGRGGALGEVPADVVAATFVFFEPGVVRTAWERSAGVMPRRRAAEEWAGRCHLWASEHLPDDRDWPTLAALVGRVSHAAPVAGAPLFAGWRCLAEPAEPRALALHRLNGLRELRGALHAAAVLTVGLSPLEAIVVRSKAMLGVFGWPEPYPEPEPLHDRWALAEARTDRMFGRQLAVLDGGERDTLVEMLGTLSR
ncbi:MAG: SCO6745 family protein [Acidimicrobiia bacterium]